MTTKTQLTKAQAEAILTRKVSKKAGVTAAMDEVMLEVQTAALDAFDVGSSYREIAAITGLSEVRIEQVLRAERERRGIPTNNKKERK